MGMNSIYKNINSYYTKKIITHGTTPKGVDWNSEQSQILRFKQLSKIIKKDNFTIADIGCGYGKYVEYLQNNFQNFDYTGYDLSQEMIQNANKDYKDMNFMHIKNMSDIVVSDYSIASGIFSVKMKHSNSEWLAYILKTLAKINEKTTNGFSFNMLTKYSEKEFMKDNLYYADPLFIFDYCKKNFAKNIRLMHDYDLYEFTILVKKD
jgi:cyclopropane fatty-acyl-phospholipid synthase-like methyltransferase